MAAKQIMYVSEVAITETPDTLTVGLAGSGTSDNSYLIFQCAQMQPSEDDKATLTDSYCVMNERGGVYYGGVTYVELCDGVLHISVSSKAARELGIRPTRDLYMQIPLQDRRRLGDGLHRIFTYGNPRQWPRLVNI